MPVVAVALVLAGCGGSGDGTPAASTTAPARTTKASSGELPVHNACPRGATATPPSAPAADAPDGLRPRVYVTTNHVTGGKKEGAPALIDVVDPAKNRVTHTITVSAQPHHIYPVPGRNEAYVSHFTGCALDIVDLRTDRVIGQAKTRFGPRHLVFGPAGRFAYAIDYYDASLSIVDTATNRTVANIPTGAYPNYPLVSNDGKRVFVVNSGTNTLTVADAVSPYRVRRTVKVGGHPFDLALTPDGRELLTANAADNTVSVVDTRTLRVTATVPIRPPGARSTSSETQKLNIRVDGAGKYAWVGDQTGSAFSVIDLRTKKLTARIPAASGADIFTEITKGPSKGTALTTARYGPFLDVVDTDPPKLLQRLKTAASCASKTCSPSYSGKTGPEGVGSHQIVFNPGQTRAYVSDRPGGALSVVDLTGSTARLIANVRTSYGAFGFPDGVAYVSFEDGLARASGD